MYEILLVFPNIFFKKLGKCFPRNTTLDLPFLSYRNRATLFGNNNSNGIGILG